MPKLQIESRDGKFTRERSILCAFACHLQHPAGAPYTHLYEVNHGQSAPRKCDSPIFGPDHRELSAYRPSIRNDLGEHSSSDIHSRPNERDPSLTDCRNNLCWRHGSGLSPASVFFPGCCVWVSIAGTLALYRRKWWYSLGYGIRTDYRTPLQYQLSRDCPATQNRLVDYISSTSPDGWSLLTYNHRPTPLSPAHAVRLDESSLLAPAHFVGFHLARFRSRPDATHTLRRLYREPATGLANPIRPSATSLGTAAFRSVIRPSRLFWPKSRPKNKLRLYREKRDLMLLPPASLDNTLNPIVQRIVQRQ